MAERMNKVDNFWLCMDEPTNLMEITAFMEFERPLDIHQLRRTIETRLTTFKRFRQKLERPASGIGVPSWVFDWNYDLRCQIQRIALPAPGDKRSPGAPRPNLPRHRQRPDRRRRPRWPAWRLLRCSRNGANSQPRPWSSRSLTGRVWCPSVSRLPPRREPAAGPVRRAGRVDLGHSAGREHEDTDDSPRPTS